MNRIILSNKTFIPLEEIIHEADYGAIELMKATRSSPKQIQNYIEKIENEENKSFSKHLKVYEKRIKNHIEEISKTRNYIDKNKQFEIYWNTSSSYHDF